MCRSRRFIVAGRESLILRLRSALLCNAQYRNFIAKLSSKVREVIMSKVREVIMGPITALKSSFSQIFQLNTRAQRSEFWWMALILLGVTCLSIFVQVYIKKHFEFSEDLNDLLTSGAVFYYLGLFGFFVSISIRRFHDTNRSAWNLLYLFIPGGLGLLVLPIMLAQKGTVGFNNYGPDAEQEKIIQAKIIYDEAEEFG